MMKWKKFEFLKILYVNIKRNQQKVKIFHLYIDIPQGHLLKANPCAYRGTCASKVLRVPWD